MGVRQVTIQQNKETVKLCLKVISTIEKTEGMGFRYAWRWEDCYFFKLIFIELLLLFDVVISIAILK